VGPEDRRAHLSDAVVVVLLRRGPAWTAEVTPGNEALQQAHASYLMKPGETGALLMAGPLSAHPTAEDVRGLVLVRAKACGDVVELFARDPKVKAGYLVPDYSGVAGADVHGAADRRGREPAAAGAVRTGVEDQDFALKCTVMSTFPMPLPGSYDVTPTHL
jgi:uncharacterized protein YciI